MSTVILRAVATACAFSAMWMSAAPQKVPASGPAPVPMAKVDLAAIGYRAVAPRVALTGATNLTVNFADSKHLLITFLSRNLIPRDVEQRTTDQDRLVHAVYVELPSGRVLAETEWRLHDRGRYLWPLSGGQFLLRVRHALYTLSPLTATPGAQLDKTILIQEKGDMIRNLEVSPDGSLLWLQTSAEPSIGDDPEEKRSSDVNFRMYELHGNAMSETGHTVLHGSVLTAPVHAMGFLSTSVENRSYWGFELVGFRGGRKELAAVETSCRPSATFLSAGEFIVSACRGGDEHTMMGVLDLQGEVKWLAAAPQNGWLSLESAPGAERFALRETLGVGGFADASVMENVRGQAVGVYRTYTGEKIFEVRTGASTQAPQNFALCSDGSMLAVWVAGGVEVYKLPPVTDKDREMARRSAESVKLDEK